MRRSKRSTELLMLKWCTSNIVHQFTVLCLITLVSSCGKSNSEITDGSNSIIEVSPIDPANDLTFVTNENDSSASNSNSNSNASDDTTNSVQEDDGTDQQSQIIANTDALSTNESVSPIVIGGLPPDCIFAVSATNVTFCYQVETRLLRAWQNDGRQWWANVLPGDNDTNVIHALRVVNGNLYTVTEVKNNGMQTGFQISMFALSGAFVKTIALDKFQDYSFVAGHRIKVADIEDNLIITGDYGLSSNNILPNQFNGTFIAVFNTTTNQVVKSNLYPQLRQTNPIQVNGDNIWLELEHEVYEVSPANLELIEPIGRFQSIPFSRSNHHQKKHSVIGFIEKPPFEALQTQMNTAFSNALQNKLEIDPDAVHDEPINCASGGTVQQSVVTDDFGSEVRTTTFDHCSMTEFSANGILLQRQTHTCGLDCEGLNKTLRALAFEVTYANGEHWSVDGYISIKETRHSYNDKAEPIDNPETVYANQTEINVFSMSDDQITIDLAQGRYQYDGTLKSGTGTWVGSGTVHYASGVTETFSVDLSRQLLNGTQSNFSGQVDANRSDGTALFVGMDTVDHSGVRYTISTAGESIQTTSTW